MIVDTSALVAILTQEQGWEALRSALIDESARLPAPAKIEFMRVAAGERLGLGEFAERLLDEYEAMGLEVVAFTDAHARLAVQANARYGAGLRNGGRLNLLDLMVYAVAVERGEALLCTGKDFAMTDVVMHSASRTQ